jgi:hypothetical protein
MSRIVIRRKKKTPQRIKIHWEKIPWKPVLIALLAILLISAGGFSFAATQESHDAFCGSCHTQPESTYLERSTTAQPVDLASHHTIQKTRCIDCHSGKGLFGRLQAELIGAKNALKWFTSTAIQPAPLTQPISDNNCLKCHQQVTQSGYVPQNQNFAGNSEAQNGHWHLNLRRWQAVDANAGRCVSCHGGHTTDGEATLFYLNQQHTISVCESCHQKLGGGD